MPRYSTYLASISALLFTVACGPSQEELDAANARIAELNNELEETTSARDEFEGRVTSLLSQNEELTSRLRALGADVERLEEHGESLSRDLDETRRALEELRERERQAQARLATFRALMERFRSMIDSGRLSVRIVRNRMVIELPSGVLFPSGRDTLMDGGEGTVAEVATVLRDIDDREFQVAGHTDNIPTGGRRFRDNWQLSAARAVTVTRVLIENGVPAARLSSAGYADTQPIASNDTPEGRAENRRIEITLMPNLDELPDLSALAE